MHGVLFENNDGLCHLANFIALIGVGNINIDITLCKARHHIAQAVDRRGDATRNEAKQYKANH